MLGADRMPAPQRFQEFLLYAFPDHARIVEHVSAIGFGGLMCLRATISAIGLYLYFLNSQVLSFRSWLPITVRLWLDRANFGRNWIST